MYLRVSLAAALAAILLSCRLAAGAPRRLPQADGPMVITPQPDPHESAHTPPPPSQGPYDSGGPGQPYEAAPARRPMCRRRPKAKAASRSRRSRRPATDSSAQVSMDLARVIEYAFQRSGRPNGYILGEEAGGAFIAGLRYGEGTLYTKDAGNHRVYWQGPSVGYDFGAEGSKTMVLVYDLRSPGEIFTTYAGVDGSAYFIGGVGITFLARGHVVLAPIRSGIGLRLGANVGYLKYTREPTWNPF